MAVPALRSDWLHVCSPSPCSHVSTEPTIKPSAIMKVREDEELLLHLVASGLGCKFEEDSSDQVPQHREAGKQSWLRLTHA